jgi:hypothetical protein
MTDTDRTDRRRSARPPAMFCAHANADGDAARCSCTALGAGPHSREAIMDYEARRAQR